MYNNIKPILIKHKTIYNKKKSPYHNNNEQEPSTMKFFKFSIWIDETFLIFRWKNFFPNNYIRIRLRVC